MDLQLNYFCIILSDPNSSEPNNLETHGLVPGHLNLGSSASHSGTTWELVRNAESEVPPKTPL